jgi:hypothetical protein
MLKIKEATSYTGGLSCKGWPGTASYAGITQIKFLGVGGDSGHPLSRAHPSSPLARYSVLCQENYHQLKVKSIIRARGLSKEKDELFFDPTFPAAGISSGDVVGELPGKLGVNETTGGVVQVPGDPMTYKATKPDTG